MGRLTYVDTTTIDLDDRILTHLQVVIGLKLRRREPFYFSWADPTGGGGRNVIWVHPSTSLRFHFDGSRRTSINRAWIDALMIAANSADGLRVLPESLSPANGDHHS
jgi:hypothetical protein